MPSEKEEDMPIMEISIIPVGTKHTSISKYIASSEKALKESKVDRCEITAMGTLLEGPSMRKLLDIAERMHKKALSCGAKRVVTHILIDDRKDKELTIRGKVDSLKQKLGICRT